MSDCRTSVTGRGTSAPVRLSLVIPAYNEAGRLSEGLSVIARHLDSLKFDSELIVVDDGSTDDTAEVVTGFAAAHPWARLISNERNLGKGASVRRGILEAAGEYIFFMDADLSVPVEELGGALEVMARNEDPILIGSRRVSGARIERRQPFVRECLGQAFTGLARILLSRRIVDFTCGFKGFRRDVARTLFSLQQCSGWAFDAEILYMARLLGLSVCQHPVRWRHHGSSRVRFPQDVWRSLSALVRIRLRAGVLIRRQRSAESLICGGGGVEVPFHGGFRHWFHSRRVRSGVKRPSARERI